ncbi:CotH kinase family protein [Paenibacillus sp. GCM10027627]|uniref:CotH kinase family protein n=1 Tax=unclassified Paenibacillus TaxID=185978 RepID=UPI0036400894
MRSQTFIKQVGCILLCAILLTGCMKEGNTGGTTDTAIIETGETVVKELDYVGQIDKTKMMTFSITADEAKWQEMLDNAANEEYISADVTINGTLIKNVGIRPKGNSSLRQIVNDDTTDRYSFKIKFDEYVENQTWLGLDKIVVNNIHSDNSYLKEYLSYDIMSYIGVDAPLYSFANIEVNGKAWGFYLAVEDLDSGYLDRTQGGEGELYKPNNDGNMGGGGMRDFAPGDGAAPGNNPPAANNGNAEQPAPPAEGNAQTPNAAGTQAQTPANGGGDQAQIPPVEGAAPGNNPPMEPPANFDPANMPDWGGRGNGGGPGRMNGGGKGVSLEYTDDQISSYSSIFDNAETKTTEEDHKRVITALKNLSTGTDLETYVDVDAVLRYFAAHTVVVNMDSYTSMMAHNFYLYENNGKISILPWDYNLSFGSFQSGSASDAINLAIDTPISGVTLEQRPLLGKLLEVPEYKEKYHEYLQQIVDGYFSGGKFEQTVSALDQLISEHVKNDPTAFTTFEKYQAAIAEIKKIGTLRAESIQGQLNGTIPSTTEGQKADSSKLIDASSVDLSKLGDFGGGRGGAGGFRPGGGQGNFPYGMGQGFPQRGNGQNAPNGQSAPNGQNAPNAQNAPSGQNTPNGQSAPAENAPNA